MNRTFAIRSVAGVTTAQVVALLPPVCIVIAASPAAEVRLALAALVAALFWELLFTGLRRRSVSFHSATTALIVLVFCPADIPLWQVIFGLSAGIVLGELVFGGRGFSFVSAAVVSLALMIISFPELGFRPASDQLAIATLPGALLLLAAGLVSLQVMLAAFAAALAALALLGQGIVPVTTGTALVFGLTFLIADPCAASATAAGRWLYGTLAGALAVLFSPVGGITSEGIVFASLLASVFAPMIDLAVVRIHINWRRRRGHV